MSERRKTRETPYALTWAVVFGYLGFLLLSAFEPQVGEYTRCAAHGEWVKASTATERVEAPPEHAHVDLDLGAPAQSIDQHMEPLGFFSLILMGGGERPELWLVSSFSHWFATAQRSTWFSYGEVWAYAPKHSPPFA